MQNVVICDGINVKLLHYFFIGDSIDDLDNKARNIVRNTYIISRGSIHICATQV